MATTVWTGALAPEALVISVTSTDFDLSTVSAATIYMCAQPDASTTVTTLSATISAQTSTSLTLTHQWQAGETATTGTFYVYASLTLTGGTITTPRDTLYVRQRFGV